MMHLIKNQDPEWKVKITQQTPNRKYDGIWNR